MWGEEVSEMGVIGDSAPQNLLAPQVLDVCAPGLLMLGQTRMGGCSCTLSLGIDPAGDQTVAVSV